MPLPPQATPTLQGGIGYSEIGMDQPHPPQGCWFSALKTCLWVVAGTVGGFALQWAQARALTSQMAQVVGGTLTECEDVRGHVGACGCVVWGGVTVCVSHSLSFYLISFDSPSSFSGRFPT